MEKVELLFLEKIFYLVKHIRIEKMAGSRTIAIPGASKTILNPDASNKLKAGSKTAELPVPDIRPAPATMLAPAPRRMGGFNFGPVLPPQKSGIL